MLFERVKRWNYLIALIALAGCAGVSPRIADNYDASNLRKRKLVVYRKVQVVAMPFGASGNFKSTFEDKGISLKDFRVKLDDLFFRELKGLASYGHIVIDTSFSGDSSQLVRFQKGDFDFSGSIPLDIPNDSVLILGLGSIDYNKRTDYSSLKSSQVFLDSKMDYVIYDPLLHSAIAGGQIAATSTSFLGFVITESDWYSDAKKSALYLVDDLNEIR